MPTGAYIEIPNVPSKRLAGFAALPLLVAFLRIGVYRFRSISSKRLERVAETLKTAAPHKVGDSRFDIDNVRQILGLD